MTTGPWERTTETKKKKQGEEKKKWVLGGTNALRRRQGAKTKKTDVTVVNRTKEKEIR
jgi:hypothetical protein